MASMVRVKRLAGKFGRCQAIVPAILVSMVGLMSTSALADTAGDQTIRSIIETFRQLPGCGKAAIVVGTNVEGQESRYASGSAVYADGHIEPAGSTTDFQIGSITKTFTATLYAQLLDEGRIKPSDPVKRYLPPNTVLPVFKDSATGETVEITVDQLARHTSGLPRQQASAAFPFSDERMFSTLDRIVLKVRPGNKYVYSNLGTALLAKAMEQVTGQSITDLYRNRVIGPLGLTRTRMSSEVDARLPVGFDRADRPTERGSSTWPAYEGSSALISTLDDMLKFLAANMDSTTQSDPLRTALTRLQDWQSVPCATALEGGQGCAAIETGLGWTRLTSKVAGLSTVWKNGMTKGFSAWIGFVAPPSGVTSKAGVVVLASQNSCPVGPLATCVLASVTRRPLAANCLPAAARVGQ